MKQFIILFAIFCGVLAQNYTCTAPGRFRYRDSTCRSYYLCVLYNGQYIQSNYTCPSNMGFNPATQTCVLNSSGFVCIEDLCEPLPLLAVIPDPNNPNCTTYIQCMGLLDRYPIIVDCPAGLYFDQDLNPNAGCWLVGNCT